MTQNAKRLVTRGLPVGLVLAGVACLAYAVWFHEVKITPAPAPTAGAEQAEPVAVREPVIVERVAHGTAVLDASGQIQQTNPADPEQPCPT